MNNKLSGESSILLRSLLVGVSVAALALLVGALILSGYCVKIDRAKESYKKDLIECVLQSCPCPKEAEHVSKADMNPVPVTPEAANAVKNTAFTANLGIVADTEAANPDSTYLHLHEEPTGLSVEYLKASLTSVCVDGTVYWFGAMGTSTVFTPRLVTSQWNSPTGPIESIVLRSCEAKCNGKGIYELNSLEESCPKSTK